MSMAHQNYQMNNPSQTYQNLFTDHSRCESQELEYTIPYAAYSPAQTQNLYANEKYEMSDSNKNTKLLPDSRSKLTAMRNFIMKEGRDEDLAREPRVLISCQKKGPEGISNSHLAPSKIKSENGHTGQDKDDFYRYCTDEIVRINNQNSDLTRQVQDLKNNLQLQRKSSEMLKEENHRLKFQVQRSRGQQAQRQLQISRLRSRLSEEEQFKLQKIKHQVQRIGDHRRGEEVEIQRYIKISADKEEKINKLMEDVRLLRLENIKLIGFAQQNERLNRKLSQFAARNHELERKAMAKSEAVDHLWNVKEIEYANIVALIHRAEEELVHSTEEKLA